MRLGILVVVLGGCAYNPPPGGDDDDDMPGETVVTVVDDTEADFTGSTELVDGLITPEGTLEPEAYVLGGLRARAFAGKLFDGTATSFDLLDATILNSTALGQRYGQLPDDWKTVRPLGLSIVSNDDFTVYYDGEIQLVAGPNTIDMDADDAGILEVTIDGTRHFLLDATSGRKSMVVDAPNAGWYPFRVAIGETINNARLSITLAAVLDPTKFRARVTNRRGLIGHLYEIGHTELLGTAAVTGFGGSFGQLAPAYDLPPPTAGNYDLRLVGQIKIDVAGTWAFEVVPNAEDTARMWIDEVHVASKWSGGFSDGLPAIATLDLTAGWHDIFLDFRVTQTQADGTVTRHNATIELLATPPGGSPAAITTDQLRPAVSSGLATAVIVVDEKLAATATDVPISLPASASRIHSLDAGYLMINGDPAEYSVTLDAGGTLISIPHTAGSPAGLLFDDLTLQGDPVPTAPWNVRFADNVAGGPTDTIAAFTFVDLITRGGPAAPFSPTVSYTSKPHATPDALRLGAVRVTGAFDDATITIAVRTADSEANLAAAAFVDVALGGIPDVEPGAFIQYRVTATSDGWQFPVIDAVELDYVVTE